MAEAPASFKTSTGMIVNRCTQDTNEAKSTLNGSRAQQLLIPSAPMLLHVAHECIHSGASAFLGSPSLYWERYKPCRKQQTDEAGVKMLMECHLASAALKQES